MLIGAPGHTPSLPTTCVRFVVSGGEASDLPISLSLSLSLPSAAAAAYATCRHTLQMAIVDSVILRP